MIASRRAVRASASRRRPAAAALILLGIAIASCERAGPPQIETTEDLVRALRELGVATTDLGPSPTDGFGVEGRRVQAGEVEIEVFEYETVEARERISTAIPADGSAVGGIPAAWPDRPHIWAAGRLIVVYIGTDGGTILLLGSLLGDSITDEPAAGEAPYPPAVAAAIHALAQDLGIDPGSIEVLDYEAVDWPDSCLGLGRPEEACLAVITPGWRIHLRAAGAEYEARTDMLGTVVRR